MEPIKLYFKNKEEYSLYLNSLIEQGICLQDQDGDINPEIFKFIFILSDKNGKEFARTKPLP